MTKCRQRPDLMRDYLLPCLVEGHETYTTVPEWTYCHQPDELNCNEYNTLVYKDGLTYYLQSIDLEFK